MPHFMASPKECGKIRGAVLVHGGRGRRMCVQYSMWVASWKRDAW